MHTTSQFHLEVTGEGLEREISFSNGSAEYAEVIFLIDGRNARDGSIIDAKTRGYAFHPRERRSLTKNVDKQPLHFKEHGIVEAIVYEGAGQPTDEMLEVPPLVRRKIGVKIKITRYSDTPSAVLRAEY